MFVAEKVLLLLVISLTAKGAERLSTFNAGLVYNVADRQTNDQIDKDGNITVALRRR